MYSVTQAHKKTLHEDNDYFNAETKVFMDDGNNT